MGEDEIRQCQMCGETSDEDASVAPRNEFEGDVTCDACWAVLMDEEMEVEDMLEEEPDLRGGVGGLDELPPEDGEGD